MSLCLRSDIVLIFGHINRPDLLSYVMHLNHSLALTYVISDMDRTFEVEPKNMTAYLGDVVMLSCKIGGIPHPSITWLKDDREISTASANFVLHEEDGILEIRSVQFPDFGRYRYAACRVCTGAGKVWKIIAFKVEIFSRTQKAGKVTLGMEKSEKFLKAMMLT